MIIPMPPLDAFRLEAFVGWLRSQTTTIGAQWI